MRLWVDAQANLTSCGAAGTSGLGLEVDPEPVLQSWVNLDWWHSSFLVSTTQEALSVLRVDLPETTLAWFILLPRHLDETLVERQIVSNGVLKTEMYIYSLYINSLIDFNK